MVDREVEALQPLDLTLELVVHELSTSKLSEIDDWV